MRSGFGPRPGGTLFLVEGLRHVFQVGTLIPSSRWLACAMTRSVRAERPPGRILEVGSGTGAITRMILRSLVEGDELHLVEVNPHFCRHLETRLLRRHRRENPGARVDLRCESITSAVFADPFDIVICTLPFFAFSPPVVRVILDRLTGLLAEGGELTYMHFAGVRLLKAPFVTPSRRRELDRIHAVSRSLRRRYGATRDFVLFNVLPSFVVRLRRNGVAARHRPGPWMRRMALAAEAYSAQGAEVG